MKRLAALALGIVLSALAFGHYALPRLLISNPTSTVVGPTLGVPTSTAPVLGAPTTTITWACVTQAGVAISGIFTTLDAADNACGAAVAADGVTRYLEERSTVTRTSTVTTTTPTTTTTSTRRYQIQGGTGVRVIAAQAALLVLADSSGAPASEDWQLDDGHFISAKMTPQIIHPRTDAEMSAYARCARAPSAIAWDCPIGVQGGAWPFYCDLTTAPSGATMQATLTYPWEPSDGLGDYCVVKWSNPTVGSHSFTVTVTDQDGTEVTRSWTLEVIDRDNATYFLFLDAVGGDDGGDGSYDDPLQTLSGFYGGAGGKADTTWQGRQIFLREGTYTTFLNTGSSSQMDFTTAKPAVWVGYPGETATIDTDVAYLDYESGNGDLAFVNLSFVNPSVTESAQTRKQFIRAAQSAAVRDLQFNLTYTGNDDASGNNSNSSAFMYTGAGACCMPNSYHYIRGNVYSNTDEMDLALFYDTEDVVIEGNEITGGYTADEGWGFFLKAMTITDVTVRANWGFGTGITLPLLYFSQFTPSSADARDNIEFAFNSYKSTDSTTGAAGAGVVGIGQGDGSTGNHYGTFWSYRNCIHNPHIGMVGIGLDDRDSSTPGPFNFENDAIDHSGSYTDGFYEASNHASVDPTKTSLRAGTAILDDTTNLLQAGESAYLGTHGCQVQ